MEDKREVSVERVEAFKRERGIIFSFETSAKTGENIESLFITSSKILYNNFKDKIAQMVSVKRIILTFLTYRKMKQSKNEKAKSSRDLRMVTEEKVCPQVAGRKSLSAVVPSDNNPKSFP